MKGLKSYFSPIRSPDQFTAFAILYMLPMIHELGYPWWSWGGQHAPLLLKSLILAAAATVALKVNAISFLFLMAISTLYFVVTAFPENPNHITLLIFCNIALLFSIPFLKFYTKCPDSNEAVFALLKPLLRLMLITLLFVAGFHKFNKDFLDPEVSCVNLVLGLLENRAFKQIFGVPVIVLASLVFVVPGCLVFRKYIRIKGNVPSFGSAILAILVFALCIGLFLSNGGFGPTIVGVGAIVVLLWQLIEGPLLFVRRFQAPILLISLLLLGIIALSGIQMFPAMLLPLLFAFIPDHVYDWWRNETIVDVGRWQVHAIYVCLFLNLFGAFLMYVNDSVSAMYSVDVVPIDVSQIFFLLSIALLLLPLFREVLSSDRKWKWEGVAAWDGKTPKILLLFPLMLFLWGMTPYLGLRTTGNFSMFSNLKTEGLVSNHLLLGSNPIKVWGYQEDRVRIIEINDEAAEIGHHYDPLESHSLPAVEFKKLVTLWRDSGREIALTYEYNSPPVRTLDIASDKNWADSRRNWETFLLDFRPVQESGPNVCRW